MRLSPAPHAFADNPRAPRRAHLVSRSATHGTSNRCRFCTRPRYSLDRPDLLEPPDVQHQLEQRDLRNLDAYVHVVGTVRGNGVNDQLVASDLGRVVEVAAPDSIVDRLRSLY